MQQTSEEFCVQLLYVRSLRSRLPNPNSLDFPELSDLETSCLNLFIFILPSSCRKTLICVWSISCCQSDLRNVLLSHRSHFPSGVRYYCLPFDSWEFIKQMIHFFYFHIIRVMIFFCLRYYLIANSKNVYFRW